MCTTYLASELILEFSECDVIGYPRLVRLNPNIPWKTRGNGALALRLGKGYGKRFLIGRIDGKERYAYKRGRSADIWKMRSRIEKIMERNAQFSDENTNPAYVIIEKKPPPGLYWRAVRGIVELGDVKGMLKEQKATFRGYKNARGLIGASAAVSWRPRDRTYEVIVYRERTRWGTERKVDEGSVIAMDKAVSSTFNNYDYTNKKVIIAPSSPCPVLFGIRGEKPKELPKAMAQIKSEKKDRWLLFETNQGTDEHLQRKSIKEISLYQSVITSGTVTTTPRNIEGGHVIFTIAKGKTIDCAAYEPTKEFRSLVRKLTVGDVVTVFGGVREKPLTVNLEKMRVEKMAKSLKKKGNPLCPKCKKRMKSAGKDAGYRCRSCRIRIGEDEVEKKKVERELSEGIYEVPVCARRHLAKPLKRYK